MNPPQLLTDVIVRFHRHPCHQPAVAQADCQPFTMGADGSTIVDGFPAGVTTITCNLASVSNDFVHCAADSQHRARAINLRCVQEITPGQSDSKATRRP